MSFRRLEDHGTVIAVRLNCGRIWKVRFLIYATGGIGCAIRSMCLSRLWKWKDENRFRIRPTVLLCAVNSRDLENSAVITALTGTNLAAAAKPRYSPICLIDPSKIHSNVPFECPTEWIQPFHALRQSKWVHTLRIIFLLQEILVKRLLSLFYDRRIIYKII